MAAINVRCVEDLDFAQVTRVPYDSLSHSASVPTLSRNDESDSPLCL